MHPKFTGVHFSTLAALNGFCCCSLVNLELMDFEIAFVSGLEVTKVTLKVLRDLSVKFCMELQIGNSSIFLEADLAYKLNCFFILRMLRYNVLIVGDFLLEPDVTLDAMTAFVFNNLVSCRHVTSHVYEMHFAGWASIFLVPFSHFFIEYLKNVVATCLQV